MLGGQILAPLHEQPDGIAFHVEARPLQGTSSVLYGGRAVADADGDIVQSGVDIDGLGFCFHLRKMPKHRVGIQVVDSFHHRLALLIAIQRQETVRFQTISTSRDGTRQTLAFHIEISLGGITQGKH